MSSPISLVLGSTLLACFIMTLVWWRQTFTQNAGIVDGWWSYIFGFLVVYYSVFAAGDITRKGLIATLVIVWSFRLGTHLLIRNSGHAEEDRRYRKLREDYGSQQNFKMWRFFMYQAFSNVLLAVPFLIICMDSSPTISYWVWIGAALWAIALLGESAADEQLKAFKKDPTSKGKVCEEGLWNYSRHPNYFFEWLIWVGYALIAMDSPFGWIAWLCPVIMYLLLNKVTGIPMLEELAVVSKGHAYVRYQQTTSSFFPWFKKK
jgi:steroid 5-alpha reductase family enzyme